MDSAPPIRDAAAEPEVRGGLGAGRSAPAASAASAAGRFHELSEFDQPGGKLFQDGRDESSLHRAETRGLAEISAPCPSACRIPK